MLLKRVTGDPFAAAYHAEEQMNGIDGGMAKSFGFRGRKVYDTPGTVCELFKLHLLGPHNGVLTDTVSSRTVFYLFCQRNANLAAGWPSDFGEGAGFSLRIRPTVVLPMCRPARASVCAILTFPIAGQSTFKRCTM